LTNNASQQTATEARVSGIRNHITSAAVASGKDHQHFGCIKLLHAINDGVAGAWLLTIG